MATVTFPDALIWAFNPNYITIAGATGSSATVSVMSTNDTRSISVALYNGGTNIYISRLVQLMFTDPENTRVMGVTFQVSIDGSTHASSATVVWGAIAIGDRFSSHGVFQTGKYPMHIRHLQYFTHFPFTLDLLCLPESTVRGRKDGDPYTEDGTATYWKDSPQVESISSSYAEMKSLSFGTDMELGTRNLVIRQDANGSDTHVGTFDQTFDETFYNPATLDIPVITVIHPNNAQEGIYLRWIDHFGFREYYLFDKGDKSQKTTLSDVKLDKTSPYVTHDDSTMYFGGHLRNKGVKTEQTIKACAVNIDEETLGYISDIVSSPLVDVYYGGTWIPVLIENGTYSHPLQHKPLHDFEITIKLPNKIAQTL